MRIFSWLTAMTCAAVLCTGCNDDSNVSSTPTKAAPLSIVVIGDSIAAGEGMNYGYTYEISDFGNHWIGGTDNPTWQGDYQLCHDSAQAYGDVLAANISASLAKFACTGSTYDNGINFDRRAAGVLYRPAQFGNWLGQTNLNPAYDAAKPDVVIVTLGADDVSFVEVFTFCATGYTAADTAEVAALALLPDPRPQLRANFLKKFPTREAWVHRAPRAVNSSSYCIASNPGAPIDTLFWDPINSGEIAGHYKSLVAAIKARGALAGKVPRIVFTTYHQPLPTANEDNDCYDMGDIARDESNYLITLEATLNSVLINAVKGIDGVSVADISHVTQGHEFCTSDPWTYGLSVLALNDDSLAPFHPVPLAQAAIAAILAPIVTAK